MARVLVGISGGIAAYKACELTRLLVKAGHEVIPLVTPSAERFVRAETFTALAAGNRSHGQSPHDLHTAPTSGALGPPTDDLYAHLTRAELLVVAPCASRSCSHRRASRASACSSPPAVHASPSTACASSAIAPRDAWASPWPKKRGGVARR